MAEFAASIIGIVSAGTKVTLVLSQLAADVGSAGKEARMIGSEIRSFCAVVKTLGDTLEQVQSSQYYAHCTELIKDMTDASLEMFTEILDASEKLRGMVKSKDRKDGKLNLVGRVQWAVFQKPKISVLRAAIEAYKSNLALMLHTLNTAEKVTRRMSTDSTLAVVVEEQNDRSLLKSLELEQQASLIDLEETEQQYEKELAETDTAGDPNTANPPKSLLDDQKLTSDDSSTNSLVGSARDEIESIRSSLSRNSTFDARYIQGQVSRHSKRLSFLMIEDQNRISQRWSASLPNLSVGSTRNMQANSYTSIKDISAAPATAHSPRKLPSPGSSWSDKFKAIGGPDPDIGFTAGVQFDPFYGQVLNWLIARPFYERKPLLNTLIRDAVDTPPRQPKTPLVTSPSSPPAISEYRPSVPPKTEMEPMEPALLYRSKAREVTRLVKHQVLVQGGATPNDLTIDLCAMKIVRLPPEIIDTLASRLTKLALARNELNDLPPSLARCSNLCQLDLSGNRFKAFPKEILQLTSLNVLDLSKNSLRALPQEISRLPGLATLYINDNMLLGLPPTLGRMSSLSLLNCNNNPLQFPPSQSIEHSPAGRPADMTGAEFVTWTRGTQQLKHLLTTTKLQPKDELAILGIPEPLPEFRYPSDPFRYPSDPSPGLSEASSPKVTNFSLPARRDESATGVDLMKTNPPQVGILGVRNPRRGGHNYQRSVPVTGTLSPGQMVQKHQKSKSHDLPNSNASRNFSPYVKARSESFNGWVPPESRFPGFPIAYKSPLPQPRVVGSSQPAYAPNPFVPAKTIFERADEVIAQSSNAPAFNSSLVPPKGGSVPDPDKFCPLCENDGHDSMECPIVD